MEKWKNIKILNDSNKFKISAPRWNDKFELTDGSYYVSDIQDYFEYIFWENIVTPLIKIFVKKNKNRIAFKIKTGYYLELLTPKTMKLLGSTKKKITKDKIGGNVPYFGIAQVVLLVHCNIVNNNYQQDSRALYTFVPNKPFGNLLQTSLKNYIFLVTFNSEFQAIEVWFTD